MARTVRERDDVLPVLADVFREHGYEGASLALISDATGLGKGSLYNFFPGGKEEMANAVLRQIDAWFEHEIYAPLRTHPDAAIAIAMTLGAVEDYFRSGRRVCLVGALALGDTRDRFSTVLHSYFARWIEALALALVRLGRTPHQSRDAAEEAVLAIQGAIVLSRAMGDTGAFTRTITRLRAALLGQPR
jgi:TetR/AcrR family transcriptional repressor of lmrAB and yxaGH operons